jgi:hypothetical protein
VRGCLTHAVHLLDQLDLSRFDRHYRSNKMISCTYAPPILLKAVLLAYSQAYTSSPAIGRAPNKKPIQGQTSFAWVSAQSGGMADVTGVKNAARIADQAIES